ncbi:helix-turn-helix domain-containing protein [Coprobacter tertius]|uniref:Helix-turn-helix transcriptional regulator n=1 Tax=Coprobacter tertius TaxID=2944915 RepID=A0ABT1ME31_9BACT|nr:helix-turn-helix transcriptional regulator [Coprobacter tertius]MCP9610890.1 helix-turn-helix transcriptional regulator [Coprobacter tertius]
MSKSNRTIYCGDRFREFLKRKGITYKEASAYLKIDKNTIGKAVRGGNLNVNVLLTICNEYHLPIEDFFKKVSLEGNGRDYENSSIKYEETNETTFLELTERYEKYKLCEKFNSTLQNMFVSKETEIQQLRELNAHYKNRIEVLEKALFEKISSVE